MCRTQRGAGIYTGLPQRTRHFSVTNFVPFILPSKAVTSRRPVSLSLWFPLFMFSTLRRVLFCLSVAFVAGAALLGGCDNTEPDPIGDNLFGLVALSENLEVLEDIVEDLALDATLRTGSDLTFFAPTDEALNSLGADMLATLRTNQNRDVMEKLIRRHLVPGRIRLVDLQDGTLLEPLAGPPLEVRIDGEEVTVGGALLTEADLETGNGVLHEVDELVRDHLTLAERLRVTPLLRSFADLLSAAGLSNLAERGEPTTLLIPINSAFDALGPAFLQSLERFNNRDVLSKILRHHVVPGRVRTDDLEDGDTLTPLDGSDLTVRVEGGLTFLGEARVIVAEVETSDGLIYLLDTVVLSHLDLAERLKIEPELTDFYTIFGDAGLLDELGGDDTFTLFVPTDNALAPLGDPFLDALRLRPDLLLRTAQYHIVPGRVEPEDLEQDGALTTLGEFSLRIQTVDDVGGPTVFVGGRGRVAFPPIETSNGLVYTIAPFILPPDLDLEERAVFGALYSFLNTMRSAGLTPLLRGEDPRGEGPYTIFAPTDLAFDGVNLPASSRRRTMEYHIVEGYYDSDQLLGADSLVLPTLAGPNIVVKDYERLGLYILETNGDATGDSVKVNDFDLRATNGVIHPVEGVLRPQ